MCVIKLNFLLCDNLKPYMIIYDWKTYYNLSLYFAVIHTNSYTKQRYSLSDDTNNKQQ